MTTKWRVIETEGTLEPKSAVIWQDEKGEIAHMVERQSDYLANAHLIAASPRMASFLKNMCAVYEDYGKIDESFYLTAKEILEDINA